MLLFMNICVHAMQCKWIVAENSNLISPARLESCRLQPSVVLTERQFTDLLSRATPPPPPPPPDVPVGPADSSSNSTRAPSVVSQATVASSAVTNFSSASTQKKGGPIVPAALARQPNSRIPADGTSIFSLLLLLL